MFWAFVLYASVRPALTLAEVVGAGGGGEVPPVPGGGDGGWGEGDTFGDVNFLCIRCSIARNGRSRGHRYVIRDR